MGSVAIQHPDELVLHDAKGQERGYVDPKVQGDRPVLEDLWIMQGSICDLKCKHCYTASSPLNEQLGQIRPDELAPFLREAADLGVGKIYFTGGEVFVNEAVLRGRARRNEDFIENLERALEIAPVEILTNARRHIREHLDDLRRLRGLYGDRLRLRVTIESPGPERHDAIRGRGTFDQTVETVVELGRMGFVPVITAERPLLEVGGDDAIREAYARLFDPHGVRVDVNLIENLLEMGHQLTQIERSGGSPKPEVFVSTGCFPILGKDPQSLMCHYSRCLQKVRGEVRVYPCPVIYDDPRYELGMTLRESLRRVYVAHKNCYDYCLKGSGASCRTRVI